MITQRTGIMLLALSAILIIAFFVNGTKIPSQLKLATTSAPIKDTTAINRLAIINQAVKTVTAVEYYNYTGGFDNPFKLWNELRNTKASKTLHAKPARTKLSLRGILIKDQPLAILENGLGETLIRATGDTAFDQIIISISDNRVTLRDRLGKYEITVEEH